MELCPKCEGMMVGVEYSYDDPYHYDGISEYECTKCHARYGRWHEQELKDNERDTPRAVYKKGVKCPVKRTI